MKSNLLTKANIILKQQRLKQSLTQEQLAEKLGTTVMNVSRWERGIISPGLHFQQKLCDLFQLSPHELGLQSSEDIAAIGRCRPKIIDPALPLTLKNTPDGIGRRTLLNQLIQQILSGSTSIALTGLPGIGKTTLAVMLASHPTIQKHFSDGILWASLGRQPQIITLLSRWGTFLEIAPSEMSGLTTIDAWGRTLRDCIGSRRMLLILDDAWEIEDTLPFYLNGHHCAHILTTRFPAIAHTFALNNVYTLPEFERDESLALLQQFIPDACEAFPHEINELIQQVGGLPLALTLIGRHLLVHTYTGPRRRVYQHLLQLIEHADKRLSIQYPSLGENIPFGSFHSLQAAIAKSCDVLSSQAQIALRTLAIFSSRLQSFSEETALSMCHIEIAILDELVDSGLLTYIMPDHYQIHPTIRDTSQLLPLRPHVERCFQL
jgi:transcriptional regulator with XRE-family HTH domain